MTPLAHIVALPVRAYRLLLSPWVGHGCRFQPTCSAYALEALDRHGALKGSYLAAHRICRCHPWAAMAMTRSPAPTPRMTATPPGRMGNIAHPTPPPPPGRMGNPAHPAAPLRPPDR